MYFSFVQFSYLIVFVFVSCLIVHRPLGIMVTEKNLLNVPTSVLEPLFSKYCFKINLVQTFGDFP